MIKIAYLLKRLDGGREISPEPVEQTLNPQDRLVHRLLSSRGRRQRYQLHKVQHNGVHTKGWNGAEGGRGISRVVVVFRGKHASEDVC